MARAFVRRGSHFLGRLDDTERSMLAGLMEQTRLLLAPIHEPTGDAFDDLVASMGVSLAAEDRLPDAGGPDEEGSAEQAGAEQAPDPARDRESGVGPKVANPRGAHPRHDPALDRLLPSAHRGDHGVAAEFRRLTEEGLRQRKSHNLDIALGRLAAAYGDRVVLSEQEAPAFLMALTDVRLLLGERMGMRTEEDAEALHAATATVADDDPLGYAMAWYDFLTWLQETLTHAVMGEDPGPDGDAAADADP